MSESVILWIFGILVTINSGIVGVLFLMLWGHIRDCRLAGEARAGALAALKSQQERLIHEVGDHETGLRGAMHKLREDLSPFAVWVQLEMQKRER
jgi:hypothetical protein